MIDTNEPGRRWHRPIAIATIGAVAVVAGAALAVALAPGFWMLVVIGAIAIGFAGFNALGRAIRPALRPQSVKYDHHWFTNFLGDTSVPHPGPAGRQDESDPSSSAHEERPQ
jgi:MFS family permease